MSASAPDWLRAELVTLAWCWRLARRDGVVIGLTSHDQDLTMGGLLYRAAPGMRPSALETSDRLDTGTMDLEGAVTSSAIAASDLDAGRWDGARLELVITDWTSPDAAPVVMTLGELGAVERKGRSFSVELLGAARALDRPICPATSPGCRASLGDRDCRVDMAGRMTMGQVIAITGRLVTLAEAGAEAGTAGSLAGGELLWADGAACGLATPIIAQDGAVLQLAEMPPIAPQAPVRVRLTQGCDKQLATCRDRFANAVNFRGEAHLPGNDLLTRYPGG